MRESTSNSSETVTLFHLKVSATFICAIYSKVRIDQLSKPLRQLAQIPRQPIFRTQAHGMGNEQSLARDQSVRIANLTEIPLVHVISQIGPLYWGVLQPGERVTRWTG